MKQNQKQKQKQVQDKTVYWTVMEHSGQSLFMAATDEGLCFVGGWNEALEELEKWTLSKYPGSALIRDDVRLSQYRNGLAAYMKGERPALDFPMAVRGTAFQQKVWNALLAIPYGETRTYTDIAAAVGSPAAVRAVGAAIGANPILIAVPCHRVIGKDGSLTGFRGGLAMKKALLALERGAASRENKPHEETVAYL
ncbi:methylated-DNA--[protein]-cysteine S-methyltransferase [Paenibacillus nanensis]|uniref:Methylated-DNA--protein-cysteine methyltransferase n=1 Tax=Paenibacillus nanensis TaxID=393251 RepID=A0A3A1UU68_9BACL|nr:methylated-DNA--[protein]-cysteine S-methyltransferase [Paenibacillus nanensis]RIX47264.1 methylated-DNA--[protein]-cysteine S-methyltransferase [Paenibacillus nanensis]